jgi:hypothetical protein
MNRVVDCNFDKVDDLPGTRWLMRLNLVIIHYEPYTADVLLTTDIKNI